MSFALNFESGKSMSLYFDNTSIIVLATAILAQCLLSAGIIYQGTFEVDVF